MMFVILIILISLNNLEIDNNDKKTQIYNKIIPNKQLNKTINAGKLTEIINKVSFIFHLAGVNRSENLKDFIAGNESLTQALCEAIKKANRIMDKHGRLLIRKSGTEPKIRIMAESYDKNLILKCIKIIKRSIKY